MIYHITYFPVAPCITAGNAAPVPPDDPPQNIPPINDTRAPHIVEQDDKIPEDSVDMDDIAPEHIVDPDGIRFAHVLPRANAVVFEIKDIHSCGIPQHATLQQIPDIVLYPPFFTFI